VLYFWGVVSGVVRARREGGLDFSSTICEFRHATASNFFVLSYFSRVYSVLRFRFQEFHSAFLWQDSDTSRRALPAHNTDRFGRNSQADIFVLAWHVIDRCRVSMNYIAILPAVVLSRRSLAIISMLLSVRADHDVVVALLRTTRAAVEVSSGGRLLFAQEEGSRSSTRLLGVHVEGSRKRLGAVSLSLRRPGMWIDDAGVRMETSARIVVLTIRKVLAEKRTICIVLWDYSWWRVIRVDPSFRGLDNSGWFTVLQ